jgi:hypothetical protein
LKNRIQEIKSKGFNIPIQEDNTDVYSQAHGPIDFTKIKVGAKMLDDAVVTIGDLKKTNPRLADKNTVLRAIHDGDIETMREISNFFFKTSGIYSRLCKYMANLYRYDWMITPYVNGDSVKPEKVEEGFYKALTYMDNFEVKKFCGDAALKVLRHGAYYGYLIAQSDRMVVQELPASYCRSRFSVNGRPAVEFNMKFFDDMYRDTFQKMRILKLFPEEFHKGYKLYKEGKLKPDFQGDTSGWYLLEPKNTIKFNMNGDDYPAFISVIPALIDLDEAQALDRKKMQQKLLKIIIQKMPMDKNGDLIFDVDEARELHNNAVKMLGKAIGIDVLTTFADVDVADMADKNTTTSVDELEKVERTVYNEAGVSQMQFNTSGNLALEKSILNDEASMYNLVLQFESFLNGCLLAPYNKNPKKLNYKAQILTTTIYNYKEMAKLYKEQTQMGYSKMLPQIALGQSQSSILANAYFENDVLDLVNVFIPPLMSSTMNPEAIGRGGGEGEDKNKDAKGKEAGKQKMPGEEKSAGRKEKPDDEKSEKTIANKESMS